ncbi:hypothetical protein ACFYTQ_24260 [Nocardia sp. NPDC004068]|uniref:hypothetical protein n=1 Tax=Nocardia sp. NPDC004068 TaxID=3364303 RepID=UPI0036A71AB4
MPPETKGRTVIPVKVRITGTPTAAHLATLEATVSRAVTTRLRTAAAREATRRADTEQDLRRRLAEVDDALSTGIGVRAPAVLADLEAERGRVLDALTTVLTDRLKDVRAQQQTGIGVRSERVWAELAAAERRISGELAAAQLLAEQAAGLRPTPELPINWFAGSTERGLSGERLVHGRYYPEATALPRNYKGIDLVEGGTRTPLTGATRFRGSSWPMTADSFRVEGGTVVQIKTLENSTAGYQAPGSITRTLGKAVEDIVNFDRATSLNEARGESVYHVEHSGAVDRRILHVELDSVPSPAQAAELESVRETCALNGIEFTYHAAEPPSPAVPGVAGLALGVAGAIGRESRRERQRETQGYAPVGSAAFADSPWYERLGGFFRGDWFESSVRSPDSVDLPVWREHVRRQAAAKKIGETLSFTWQTRDRSRPDDHTIDVLVRYRKSPDARWVVESVDDAPEGFTAPDLDRILDPAVSDLDISIMLKIGGA